MGPGANKKQKFVCRDCLQIFLLLFMSLLKAQIVKTVIAWLKFTLSFEQYVLGQTGKSFNIKFRLH